MKSSRLKTKVVDFILEIKINPMKKVNSILMVVATATLIFSSCSQQRYSSRAKVKVNNQAKEQLVESPKEVVAITPKKIDIPSPAVATHEASSAQKPESVAPAPSKKEVLKQLRSKETRTMLSEIAKNPVQVKDILAKEDNKTKQRIEAQTGLNTNSRGVQLMILGLIIILVGIILGWLIPGLGGLIGWIGSVVFIVGLIIWLLELI